MNKLLSATMLITTAAIIGFFTFPVTQALAHGDKTSIVPASLSVKSGTEVTVSVQGLTGTDKAGFELKGMFGKYDLGEHTVSKDDFEQILKIPDNVPPGSYSLKVTGGKKSAKVVITVN
ncbi:MAG: hypothetical protein HOG03_16505 [Desulfobacula sp.]|jgi:hypothetical protein|uniref:hypothetical protein n=1 Tax=Desulfobacula sp. TaxID=2593537 RepID=UPI001D48167E|nr:hypothetical protein [Desulfobacula sp.]MBT3484332.1 hypothetical protein [Desulfobacula sp.]MBT3806181.1 hypothetical protein [Desulfobacula sp.]MBT4024141.1 hypothetical protein [Desulfobacula sp.]MBT4197465.1 hypothetical protein [Desulfobacula sp.]